MTYHCTHIEEIPEVGLHNFDIYDDVRDQPFVWNIEQRGVRGSCNYHVFARGVENSSIICDGFVKPELLNEALEYIAALIGVHTGCWLDKEDS